MSTETNTSSAKVLPPYMSLIGIDKLMNLVSSRKLSEVTTDYLSTYGFSKSDAYLGLATLRFLNLVDDKGRANDTIKKFLIQGEQGKKDIKVIIEKAYEKIFSAMDDPQKLDSKELTNEFIHHYDLSPRVARSAVPAFLYLCERAGLKEPTTQIKKRMPESATQRKASSNRGPKTTTQEKVVAEDNVTKFPFGDGRVTLSVPHDEMFTKVVLSKEFRDASDAIEKLASAFFPAQLTGDQSTEDDDV